MKTILNDFGHRKKNSDIESSVKVTAKHSESNHIISESNHELYSLNLLN